MSIVLIVLGCILVLAGIVFAWVNKATDAAGGSGLKHFAVEGPAWLVLVVVGCAATALGVIRWEDAEKQEPQTEPTVPQSDDVFELFPTGFTFGDDNQLDRLWRSCERGAWDDCDELYWISDVGSEYEWFGATCGFVFTEPVGGCA